MVQITFTSSLDKKNTDKNGTAARVFLIAEDLRLDKEARKADQWFGGALSSALGDTPSFKGKTGDFLFVRCFSREGTLVPLILLGAGKADAPERLGAKAAAALEKAKITACVVFFDKMGKIPLPAFAARFAQGAHLRLYRFEKYKTKKKEKNDNARLENLTLVLEDAAKAKALFDPLRKIDDGVFFARDLANEPANVLYPEIFADKIVALKELGIKIDILNEDQMARLGMGSLLCVSKGSVRPPRLVVMTWNGNKSQKAPIALIGKGVTFDTGGISLKSPAGMWDMKYDMCGAAAVVGAMKALASRKAKAHVVGLVGLVENMPSGSATRPGDIVTSASGQTIDVQNTDAEGRLVLADVLWYAQKKFAPRCLVDIATLTGAMRVSLGQEYAGLFANDDKLAAALLEAGKDVGEPLWRMPMCEGYDRKLDSPIADMKNIGGPEAGSCTGAHFLKRFINEGTPWAHMDVTAVAYDNKNHSFAPEGPVGFGVRLLDRFVENMVKS